MYRYQRHEYLYIDTYFTNEEQSGGQTIIYIDHGMTPAWLMQYHGWCKNDEKLVLTFLKEVLAETYRSRKFVGGRGKTFSESSNHPLRYFNKWSGTFCDFSGQERIEIEAPKDDVSSDWKDVFWHRYHGLMLLPGYDIGK